jgi:hypothetical protein
VLREDNIESDHIVGRNLAAYSQRSVVADGLANPCVLYLLGLQSVTYKDRLRVFTLPYKTGIYGMRLCTKRP